MTNRQDSRFALRSNPQGELQGCSECIPPWTGSRLVKKVPLFDGLEMVTTCIAQCDSHCQAIHLNMVAAQPTPEQMAHLSDEDNACLEAMQYYMEWDSGYSKQQSTRPQTIGYSLVDSPVGLLAWIAEKYYYWTDCNGDPERALSKDDMLDNIMVYWLNASGASSARIYWEQRDGFINGEISTPTHVTLFPKEIIRVWRRWAENHYKNIVSWNLAEQGGHFAAFEQPDLFVDELRRSFSHQP